MTTKILVADDEFDLLKVLLFRLNHAGYEARGAVDGRDVLEKARSMMPDMMILDVFLPVMRGDAVTKLLKRDAMLKHIPVILISADTKNLERRSRECGAEGCLAKPFESEALIGVIRKNSVFS